MKIDVFHKVVESLIRRKATGVFVNHAQIDLYADMAQLKKFMTYYGNPREYQPGLPLPRMAYSQTQKISDALNKFKVPSAVYGLGPVGQLPLPSDYIHLISLDTTDDNPIAVKNDNERSYALKSQIDPVESNPFAVVEDSYLSIYPDSIESVKMSYLRRPKRPMFAYSMNGREVVYNEAVSQDLEWSDIEVNDIIFTTLNYFGIQISRNDIVQVTELKDEKGT